MIFLADIDKAAVGGVIRISVKSPVFKLVNGNMSPLASWIVLWCWWGCSPRCPFRGQPGAGRTG